MFGYELVVNPGKVEVSQCIVRRIVDSLGLPREARWKFASYLLGLSSQRIPLAWCTSGGNWVLPKCHFVNICQWW